MPDAAIFDLDRTLIAGGTGRVFQRHLREAGVGPDRELPLGRVLYRLFEVAGENPLSMQFLRLGVRATRGWPVDAVRTAAEKAADELVDAMPAYARLTIDEHRDAGRMVVLATTTPLDLVGPLADRLGFDGVVATRWAREADEYAGRLDGPFVWGRGKLGAVRAWAVAVGVDLRRCWAYSDSFYDAPLLATVGHPTAVNPDPRLFATACLQGWPVRWFDVPEGVLKFAGRELQEWLRPLTHDAFLPGIRFEVHGLERIPAVGPAIVAFNHRSYFDVTAAAVAVARAGRTARGLGKRELFDAPIVGGLARAVGGIPVDRGTGSDEPLRRAEQALSAGELIVMAPQGTIPRGPAFFEPVLQGRPGCARLAARTGVPVLPMGLWGTEAVWPRSRRLPRLDVIDPATVTVRVGPPLQLGGDDVEEDTRRLMAAIVDQLPPEARVRRTTTEEELRRTYPPGPIRSAG